MKKLAIIGLLFVTLSCKTTHQSVENNARPIIKGSTEGVVSHQYRKSGCQTVIVIKNLQETFTIIPVEGFDAKYDKDNLKISFDYLPLKMKNPDGCNVGIPAEIKNITVDK